MPGMDEIKSSWADEVELDSGSLPPPTEVVDNGTKVVTEYKYNKDDKKIKVVRSYKITKQVVPKSVAQRKVWKKFGESSHDAPGPNSHTTMVSEDIFMQFVSSKEEEKQVDLTIDPSKSTAKCRICNGDHWSVNCPYKGTSLYNDKMNEPKTAAPAAETAVTSGKPGKYIPPCMKDQGKGGMAGGMRGGRGDDTPAIRISNLSEAMVESDLEELVKKFGPHSKMYLARDKNTGLCKGFAYVHFNNRKHAAQAIEVLNGHGYDHLILNVEWSKPQNN